MAETEGERRLRVLIVLNAFERDGPGGLVARLCELWTSVHGVAVDVVAISRDGSLRPLLERAGADPVFLPARGIGGVRLLSSWMGERMRGPKRPDVVHTHLLWPDLALRLARRSFRGIPLVSTCHGLNLWWDKPFVPAAAYAVAERLTRSRCAATAAVSEDVGRALRRAGHPAKRVRVIRNGVDVRRIAPLDDRQRARVRGLLGVSADQPLLVAAGTLRRLKGHDTLLEALAALRKRHPNLRCLVFGDGPEREALLGLGGALGLGETVRFPGVLATMSHRVLAASDIVVHPSRQEAYGLTVAEAQAGGVPVVASCVGGLPEVVLDGRTGLLVPPDSPERLADAVGRLIDDADLRRRMGSAAREHAVADLDIARTAGEYVEFWQDAIAGRFG